MRFVQKQTQRESKREVEMGRGGAWMMSASALFWQGRMSCRCRDPGPQTSVLCLFLIKAISSKISGRMAICHMDNGKTVPVISKTCLRHFVVISFLMCDLCWSPSVSAVPAVACLEHAVANSDSKVHRPCQNVQKTGRKTENNGETIRKCAETASIFNA